VPRGGCFVFSSIEEEEGLSPACLHLTYDFYRASLAIAHFLYDMHLRAPFMHLNVQKKEEGLSPACLVIR